MRYQSTATADASSRRARGPRRVLQGVRPSVIQGFSLGTPGYSRGTSLVLQGFSMTTPGYSRGTSLVLQGCSMGTPGYFKRRFGRCLIVDADGRKHNNLLVQKSCETLLLPLQDRIHSSFGHSSRRTFASCGRRYAQLAGHAEMPDCRQTDAKVGETVWEAQLAQQVCAVSE